MTGWADEIQTSVNAQVDLLLADWLLFLEHVGFVLVVKELDDGLPGITVVHVITEARSVNDSETDCNLHQRLQLREYWLNVPLKNFSSSSAFVISISTVLSICLL